MSAASNGRPRSEWRAIGRIGAVSLAAHLSLGYTVATHESAAFVAPGVWGIDEPAPVALRLADEAPPALADYRPLPVPQLPPARGEDPEKRHPGGSREEQAPRGRESGGGGGDPLARVTQAGVLGHLNGSSDGTRVSSFEGGVVNASDGIAQLLRGVGAVRRSSGSARGGSPGIGFGDGVGSGFGGGVATMRAEDLVASFGDGHGREIVLEKKGALSGGGELPYIEGGGCREEAEIARIVQGHRGAVRGCYNRSLLRNPEEEGEVGVRFVIDSSGRVTSAEILSRTFHDSAMESCILERMREWKFPPTDDCETIVRYSFHFSSGP